MNLAAIKPVLLAWVASATGLDAVWEDDQRPYFPGTQPHAMVAFRSPGALGMDETRWEDRSEDIDPPPPGEELVPHQVGQRAFTLSIRVETYSHVPGEEAHAFLERARTRLRAPSSLAVFAAAGLAVVNAAPLAELTVERDQRIVSTAVLDIRFGATAHFEDAPTTFIDEAELVSALEGPDGALVSAALQMPLEPETP